MPNSMWSEARIGWLLNASNMRTYKLTWSDRSPPTVIGTDGGLLGAAVERDGVMLAPAERIDLWVDSAAGRRGQNGRYKACRSTAVWTGGR